MKSKHLSLPQENIILGLLHTEVKKRMTMSRFKLISILLVKFIFLGSVMVLAYSRLYRPVPAAAFIAAYICFGVTCLLFAFNFAHDFSHNTVFRKKKFNHAAFVFIYALNGAHAEAWKHRHIHSHHFAPNVEEYDSDLQISNLIRVTPGSPLLWFHRFQNVYAPLLYTTYSLYWIFVKDFVMLFKKEPGLKKDIPFHCLFWLQKLFYVLYLFVLPLLFSPQAAGTVIAGFLCMHLVQSSFLLFTFFMTHHVESTAYPTTSADGTIQTSWFMNQVKSSNDMHPFSQLANFIFGGFNNHVAHHLFPKIHHIYYPELNRIIYEILRRNNIIPNQTTYWGGIVSHLRLLKKMGTTA